VLVLLREIHHLLLSIVVLKIGTVVQVHIAAVTVLFKNSVGAVVCRRDLGQIAPAEL